MLSSQLIKLSNTGDRAKMIMIIRFISIIIKNLLVFRSVNISNLGIATAFAYGIILSGEVSILTFIGNG